MGIDYFAGSLVSSGGLPDDQGAAVSDVYYHTDLPSPERPCCGHADELQTGGELQFQQIAEYRSESVRFEYVGGNYHRNGGFRRLTAGWQTSPREIPEKICNFWSLVREFHAGNGCSSGKYQISPDCFLG